MEAPLGWPIDHSASCRVNCNYRQLIRGTNGTARVLRVARSECGPDNRDHLGIAELLIGMTGK